MEQENQKQTDIMFDENGLYVKDGILFAINEDTFKSGTIIIPEEVKYANRDSIDERNFSLRNLRTGENFVFYTENIIIYYSSFEDLQNLLKSPGFEKAIKNTWRKNYKLKGPKLTREEEMIITKLIRYNNLKIEIIKNENELNILTYGYKVEDGILTRIDSNFTDIKIPEGVKRIDASSAVFIRNITLPETVVSLENDALSKSYSLEQINLPSSIIKVGKNVLSDCNKLGEVNFSTSVSKIGKGFLHNCGSIERLIIRYNDFEDLKTFINQNLETFYNIFFEHKSKNNKINIILEGPELKLREKLSTILLLDYNPRRISFITKEDLLNLREELLNSNEQKLSL